jgi:uncharacterized delta-60 repeat protein
MHAVGRTYAVAILALALGVDPCRAELPGDFDPTFNGGQPVLLDAARTVPRSTYVNGLTFDPSGGIILTGNATDETGRNGVLLARLGADGVLDTSFGTNGSIVVQLGLGTGTYAPSSRGTAIGARPGGAGWLVAGGATAVDERGVALAAAFDANGMLDIGFGNGGAVRPQPAGATGTTSAERGTIGPDGSVYVPATVEELMPPNMRRFAVSKVTSAGQLDTGFGNVPAQGSYVNAFSEVTDPQSYGGAALVTSAGLLVAGTTLDENSAQQLLVVRLTASGGLDPGFGGGTGYFRDQVADPVAATPASQGNAIAVGPDGEIYGGGVATDGDDRFAIGVTRLTPGGMLDTSFGAFGTRRVQTGGAGTNFPIVTTLLVQADGKVVVLAASRIGQGIFEAVLLRLDVDGDLDPSFGANGIVRLLYGDDTFPGRAEFSPDAQSVVVTGSATIESESNGFVSRILLVPFTPTTTTTTLPGGCAPPPLLAGARCRLAALGATIDAATAPGKLETKLARTLTRADGRLASAESLAGKALRKKLKKARTPVRRLGKQLGSKAAQRAIGADQRTALVAEAAALAEELRVLMGAA